MSKVHRSVLEVPTEGTVELAVFSKSAVTFRVSRSARQLEVRTSAEEPLRIQEMPPDPGASGSATVSYMVGSAQDFRPDAPDNAKITLVVPRRIANRVELSGWCNGSNIGIWGLKDTPARIGSLLLMGGTIRGDNVEMTGKIIQVGVKADITLRRANLAKWLAEGVQRLQLDNESTCDIDFVDGTSGPVDVVLSVFEHANTDQLARAVVTGMPWTLNERKGLDSSTTAMPKIVSRGASLPQLDAPGLGG